MLAPVETVSLPVEESRRKVLQLVVPLGLMWVERTVPIVMVSKPVPDGARMGLPRVLDRRTRRLTGSPSGGSPPAR